MYKIILSVLLAMSFAVSVNASKESNLHYGNQAIYTREYDKAYQYFSRVLEEDPVNVEALCGLAKIAEQKKDMKAAITCYDYAIMYDKKNHLLYNGRGVLRQKTKNYDGALKDFEKAKSLKPTYTQTYLNLAKLKEILGADGEALENYAMALQYDPYYLDAYYKKAVLEERLGLYSQAIDDYQQVLSLDDSYTDIYIKIALAEYKLGQKSQAMEHAKVAMNIFKNLGRTQEYEYAKDIWYRMKNNTLYALKKQNY